MDFKASTNVCLNKSAIANFVIYFFPFINENFLNLLPYVNTLCLQAVIKKVFHILKNNIKQISKKIKNKK